MKALARLSTPALPALVVAGCAEQVVWQKRIDADGDETATALTTDGANYHVSHTAVAADDSGQPGWYVTRLDRSGNDLRSSTYPDLLFVACEDIKTNGRRHAFTTGRTRAQGKDICTVIRYAADGSIARQMGLAIGSEGYR